jgi:hypothetical protein
MLHVLRIQQDICPTSFLHLPNHVYPLMHRLVIPVPTLHTTHSPAYLLNCLVASLPATASKSRLPMRQSNDIQLASCQHQVPIPSRLTHTHILFIL